MANRLHLTIGEVLSLLREEFPDVSISKIRFLESQGLVEPERTPSGYRKFYDHDVDRLRWILRQQREHFLPLKVIRGRLTGQEGDDPTGSSRLIAVESIVVVEEVALVEAPPSEDAAPGDLAVGTGVSEAPAMNGAETFGRAVAPEDLGPADRPEADRLFGPDDPPAGETEGSAPVPVEPVTGAPVLPERVLEELVLEELLPEELLPEEQVAGDGMTAGAGADDTGVGDTGVGDTGVGDTVVEEAVVEEAVVEDAGPEEIVIGDTASEVVVAAPEGSEPSAPGSDGAGADRVGTPVPAPAGAGTPDIFSVAEIAEAVGCTPQLIRELQQFGILVAASDVGGKMYFEPDAVGLARVGARFAELGVEPRHLRTWRNAADREASLFEQLVMPLLRQRNPQSRRRAAERLDELSTLGSQLRAGLLAEAVRGIK
jgi:DNA-binding transcriptional MerR regulator